MNLRLVQRDLTARLESKRLRYRALESPSAEGSVDSGGGPDLDGDAAMCSQNRLDNIAERSRLYVECRTLVDALARVKAGRYGVCEGCDQMIPDARLAVMPMAELCEPCKRGQESRATRALRGRAWTPEPDDEPVPATENALTFPAAHDKGQEW